jgi:pSer/pThr/pTyr-binding forkhead associated (FHA) protein
VLVVIAAFVFIVVLIGCVVVAVRWRAKRALRSHGLPPLVIPIRPRGGSDPEPAPWRAPRPATQAHVEPALATDGDQAAPTATVRFRRPTDEAVQLLPGRLEVLAGEPRHKEIRFVRVPGEETAVVLGRESGDSPHHIALQSTTVSRRHARLAYANGRWAVANLSHTNPVVLNDERLASGDGERPLLDGDRLELGEVILRFHAR